jgi:acyl-[acyl-carrier-protein]-phospholipid O-acyltransferase/long-chain-fatty-acid--[acyl-carrier-protein] ligase
MDNANPTNSRPVGSLRGFWSLFATQFQGAFSDNLFRYVVLFMLTAQFTDDLDQRDKLIPLVGALFVLPFVVFSMAGGFLADRFSKRTVTIATKVAEVVIMCVALAGFVFDQVYFLLAVIFLMASQSAFFSPSKYGILPELLEEKRLSWGNGIFQCRNHDCDYCGHCLGWVFVG